MLGAETEEKLFDAPLSISKREQLEQQVKSRRFLGRPGGGGVALPALSRPGV